MANVDIFKTLYAKRVSPLEFKWDTMIAPPLLYLLTPQDIFNLNYIASSNRLASKPKEKYKMIDDILVPRGFKYLASGTNRVIYKYLEDQNLCIKVAFDKVGLKDNPMEFENQFKLKPYVTRIFEVSPCGTVALVERVEPITCREEYLHIIDDVFYMLVEKIIGKYVVDDIGTDFFQNIGVRQSWGPVLLDYPYVYELDGKKLYCNRFDQDTGQYCLGEIDYDDGFNYLVCNKCGKKYQARQLSKQVEKKSIIVKGKGAKKAMSIKLMRGDEVVEVIKTGNESKTIMPNNKHEERHNGVRLRNKGNFEKRKKAKEDYEKRRAEDVKKAKKEKMNETINKIDSIHQDIYSGQMKTDEYKVETVYVNAAEAAADANPEYAETGRFPRVRAKVFRGDEEQKYSEESVDNGQREKEEDTENEYNNTSRAGTTESDNQTGGEPAGTSGRDSEDDQESMEVEQSVESSVQELREAGESISSDNDEEFSDSTTDDSQEDESTYDQEEDHAENNGVVEVPIPREESEDQADAINEGLANEDIATEEDMKDTSWKNPLMVKDVVITTNREEVSDSY